LITIR